MKHFVVNHVIRIFQVHVLPLPVFKLWYSSLCYPMGYGNEASDEAPRSVSYVGLRGQCGPSFSSQKAMLGGPMGDWMEARGGSSENWSLAEDKWAF